MSEARPWADPLASAWRNDPAAHALEAALDDAAPVRLRQARALAVLDACRHHRDEGCATLEEYGERRGLAARETRMLAHVGHCLEAVPGLEAALLARRLTFESAQALWSIVRPHPDEPASKQRPVAKWLRLACLASTREFRRLARWIRAAERLGEPPEALSFYVSAKTRARWRRVKIVARQRDKRGFTEDELLEQVIEDWLEQHDLMAKEGRARRLVDRTDRHGRYVPMAVRRVVWERDGGHCIFPGCTYPGELHLGHITPFAAGGRNEADELCLQCALHNQMERLGMVKVIGDAWNPGFQSRLGRTEAEGLGRPTYGLAFQAEERKRRADHAKRRYLGVPLPAASEEAEHVFGEVETPPARDAAAGNEPIDDGLVTDRRLHIPYLEAADRSKLERWLRELFELFEESERAHRAQARPKDPRGSRRGPARSRGSRRPATPSEHDRKPGHGARAPPGESG